METAFARKQSAQLSQLLPRLAGHPLEAYGAYWELSARLEQAEHSEIRHFLQRWQGSYFEDRLRNDWLLLLGKQGDAANFAQEYPKFRMRDDPNLRCWAASFGLERDAAVFWQDWAAMRGSSDACTAAAGRLLAGGQIKREHIIRKARMAAEARQHGSAAEVAGLVDASLSAGLRAHLGRAAASLRQGEASGELALQLLGRWAADKPDEAADWLRNNSRVLNQEQRDWAWGVVGKHAALELSNSAPHYYSQAQAMQGWSDDMLGWRVRSMMRAGLPQNSAQILASIAAMSPQAQNDSTWLYWKARALAASGRKAEAQNIYQGMASVQGFYELLALEETGAKVQLPVSASPPTAAEMAAARQNPGLQRALYALQIGVASFGNREWNYVAHLHQPGGLPSRELLAAAELACERQIWDRCINSSERNRGAFAVWQRYPTPFRNEVLRHSAAVGMDPAYVYGLIRQESRFMVRARSGVGASGLMQIMPATAQWTARKIGMTDFNPAQTYHSDTNVKLGVNYLHLQLQDFSGSRPLAAAAYNAGPNRPKRWREGAGPLEGAIWAENVPFSETRDYVKQVLANSTLYGVVLEGRPQSLHERLGTVRPAPFSY